MYCAIFMMRFFLTAGFPSRRMGLWIPPQYGSWGVMFLDRRFEARLLCSIWLAFVAVEILQKT